VAGHTSDFALSRGRRSPLDVRELGLQMRLAQSGRSGRFGQAMRPRRPAVPAVLASDPGCFVIGGAHRFNLGVCQNDKKFLG